MRENGSSPEAKTYAFEELLAEKGYIIYTNVGCSMLPLLRERRDIIEIRPLPSRPRKLDVVLYKRGNQYILHRVLKVVDGGYLIAGDHNTFIERDVTDQMILGRMTRVIRDGREIKVDEDRRYRIYSHLVVTLFPVKVVLRRMRSLLSRCVRRIRKTARKSRRE